MYHISLIVSFFKETGKFVFPATLDMSPYEEKVSYDEDNIHIRKIHVYTVCY